MKPSRKTPPTQAHPYNSRNDFYPPSKTVIDSPPQGSVKDVNHCQHSVKIYDAKNKRTICWHCGLREDATLKIRKSGTNLPDSVITFGDLVGSLPPRRNDVK